MVAGKYLTYEEAGVALGLSAGYVKHLVSDGKLHSVKAKEAGHKGVTKYISDKELEAYKQRKLTGPKQQVPANNISQSDLSSVIHDIQQQYAGLIDLALQRMRDVAITGIQGFESSVNAILATQALSKEEKAEVIRNVSKEYPEVVQRGGTPEALADAMTHATGASQTFNQQMQDALSTLFKETAETPIEGSIQPA